MKKTVSFTQDKSDSDHYIQECEWCEEVHWSGLHCTLVWCTSDSEFYTRHYSRVTVNTTFKSVSGVKRYTGGPLVYTVHWSGAE